MGRLVYADVVPEDALPPATIGEAATDADGRWELDLHQTDNIANVYYRIRIWQYGTFWVDVPAPPGDNSPVSVDTIGIPMPAPPDPPSTVPGSFVLRSELAKPGGVATLDSAGILTLSQRPSGGGTGETVDWFFGDGPPSVVPGAGLNDLYVDRLTGDLYKLT